MCSKCAKWIHRISCWKTRELDIQIRFNDNEFDEIILLILSFISILVFVMPNPLSDDDSYFTTPVFSVKIQILGDSSFSTFLLWSLVIESQFVPNPKCRFFATDRWLTAHLLVFFQADEEYLLQYPIKNTSYGTLHTRTLGLRFQVNSSTGWPRKFGIVT